MSKLLVILLTILFLLVMVLLLVTYPAHQPSGVHGAPGFFLGFVHGLLIPYSFIVSLFTHVRIYAFPNAGLWYDFGFVLGLWVLGGGGVMLKRRRRYR